MKYQICQLVKIVDLNDEIIQETVFDHGIHELPQLQIGMIIETKKVGLSSFDVVYDHRYGETTKNTIVSIEMNIVKQPYEVVVYLQPLTLIIGQHDVGSI